MTFCIGFLCSIRQVKSHLCGACGGRRRMEWLYWQAGWETWEVWVVVHYLIVCSNSLPFPAWWKADLPHPIIQAKSQCCSSPLGSWLLWYSSLWISYKRVKFCKAQIPSYSPTEIFYSEVKLRSSFGVSISHKTKLQTSLCKGSPGNGPLEFVLARLGPEWVMGRSSLVQRETWAVFEYKIGILVLPPSCLGNTWKFCCFLYMIVMSLADLCRCVPGNPSFDHFDEPSVSQEYQFTHNL